MTASLSRKVRLVGTAANATTATRTYTLPTGWEAGEWAYLVIESTGNRAISDAGGSTWNLVGRSTTATGSVLQVYEAKLTSGSGTVTVDADADHQVGRIYVFPGCPADGSTLAAQVVTGGEDTSDTSWSITGGTTTVDGSTWVVCVSRDNDASSTTAFSAWTNADLTSITEAGEFGTTSGNGGGGCLTYGIDTTAGTVGATTVTNATAARKNWVCFQLPPLTYSNLTVRTLAQLSSTQYDFAWAVGTSVVVRDNKGTGATDGDLLLFTFQTSNNYNMLYASQDGGITWSAVGAAISLSLGPVEAMTQTSDGNLHFISSYANITYTRVTLTRDANGHVTGRTAAVTSGAFPSAINNITVSFANRCDIRAVTINSVEKLVVSVLTNNGSDTANHIAYACASTNATPTSANTSWNTLTGTNNAVTTISSSTTIGSYYYMQKVAQVAANGSLVFVQGQASTGDSDSADISKPCQYYVCTANGSWWNAPGSAANIGDREQISTVWYPWSFCAIYTVPALSRVYVMSCKPGTGIVFHYIDSSGNLTSNPFSSPWAAGVPSVTMVRGAFTVSSDGAKCYAAAHTYSPSQAVKWAYYDGSSWTTFYDPSTFTNGTDYPAYHNVESYNGGLIMAGSNRQGTNSVYKVGALYSADTGNSGSGTAAFSQFASDGSGSISLSGSGSAALSIFGASGSGLVDITASGEASFASFEASGAGGLLLPVSGSGDASFASFGGSGSGASSIDGSGSAELSQFAGSGSGNQSAGIDGSGSASLASFGASGAGALSLRGSGSAEFSRFAASGSAIVACSGSGSATVSSFEADASGNVFAGVSGSGAAAVSSFAATGGAEVACYGSGAAAVTSLGASGSGADTVSGSGAAALSRFAATGTSDISIAGSGEGIFKSFAALADGLIEIYSDGEAEFSSFGAAGLGGQATGIVGSGTAALSSFGSTGSGALSVAGLGGATFASFGASGFATLALAVTGYGEAAFASLGASGTGADSISGSGAATFSQYAASGGALVTVAGSGSAAIASFAATGSGGASYIGIGGAAFSTLAASGIGVAAQPPIYGSGSAAFSSWTAIGQAVLGALTVGTIQVTRGNWGSITREILSAGSIVRGDIQ